MCNCSNIQYFYNSDYNILVGTNNKYEEQAISKSDTEFTEENVDKPYIKIIYRVKFNKTDATNQTYDYRIKKDYDEFVEGTVRYKFPSRYEIVLPTGTL